MSDFSYNYCGILSDFVWQILRPGVLKPAWSTSGSINRQVTVITCPSKRHAPFTCRHTRTTRPVLWVLFFFCFFKFIHSLLTRCQPVGLARKDLSTPTCLPRGSGSETLAQYGGNLIANNEGGKSCERVAGESDDSQINSTCSESDQIKLYPGLLGSQIRNSREICYYSSGLDVPDTDLLLLRRQLWKLRRFFLCLFIPWVGRDERCYGISITNYGISVRCYGIPIFHP